MPEKERRQTTRMQVPLIGTATYESRDKESQTIPVIAENISKEGAYLTAKNYPAILGKLKMPCVADVLKRTPQ